MKTLLLISILISSLCETSDRNERNRGKLFFYDCSDVELMNHEKKKEELTLDNKGCILHGTLLLPEKFEKSVPLVILIAGSGPTDRNGNSILLPSECNKYKMLAEELVKNHIATFRYDKRAVGFSKLSPERRAELTFQDYVDDVIGWVDFLKQDNRFSKVIIAGHSEGSLIGILAAQVSKIDAFISIAGSGRNMGQILLDQLTENLAGHPLLDTAAVYIDKLRKGEPVETINPNLTSIFHPSIHPFLGEYFRYNPSEEIKNLDIPVLIIQGSTDAQTDIKDAQLLFNAKNNAELVIIEGMNHALKTAPRDDIEANFNFELPVNPKLVDSLVQFINNLQEENEKLKAISIKDFTSVKIGVDYRIGINYVTHLYTIANIGFVDEEYSYLYAHTVSKEDISVLQKYSSFLKFGQGISGMLTSWFFFIPAYADLKSKNDYQQYRGDFAIAIENKSCETVEKYFPDNQKKMFCQIFSVDDKEWQHIFMTIMDVYVNNIDAYLNDVFPKIEKDLSKRSEHLNNRVNQNNIIANWEELTGYNWTYGDKTYLLFKAGKQGPSFNNLSENINTLYYKVNEDYVLDMFSHEFGIFLMFDSIMPFYQEFGKKYPPYENKITVGRVNWMAFEMLATFYNCKINARKTWDYYIFEHADPIAFMTIYETLYSSGTTNPVDLYRKGVMEYMKPSGMWEIGVEDRNQDFVKEKSTR